MDVNGTLRFDGDPDETASDARAELRKRWTGAVEKLGPGHRTARPGLGIDTPDVATATGQVRHDVGTLGVKSAPLPPAEKPNSGQHQAPKCNPKANLGESYPRSPVRTKQLN